MKKIIILAIVLFTLTSCFNSIGTNNNISSSLGTDNLSIEKSKKKYNKESFLNQEIPKGYKLSNGPLLSFENIILGNKEYFLNNRKDELEYYNIMRGLFFGETNLEINELNDCLEGKITFDKLKNNEFKKICEGNNEYIRKIDTNYFEIKDFLLAFKKIKDNKEVCNYFINKNYNIDFDYIYKKNKNDYISGKDAENYTKLINYLICNKFQNKNYDLVKNIFLYQRAIDIEKCNYLEDKNLIKLCNEKVGIIKSIKK